MKNTYKFKFRPLIIVIAVILNILLAFILVVDMLKLIGVGDFKSVNIGLDVSAVVIAIALAVIVNVILFGSSYTFKESSLICSIGFSRNKIRYNDMIVIRVEKSTKTMVLNYKRAERDKDGSENMYINGVLININDKYKDAFVEKIKSHNSKVLYEIIDKGLEEEE